MTCEFISSTVMHWERGCFDFQLKIYESSLAHLKSLLTPLKSIYKELYFKPASCGLWFCDNLCSNKFTPFLSACRQVRSLLADLEETVNQISYGEDPPVWEAALDLLDGHLHPDHYIALKVTTWHSVSVFFKFFNNKKWFYCIFYQINPLVPDAHYSERPDKPVS